MLCVRSDLMPRCKRTDRKKQIKNEPCRWLERKEGATWGHWLEALSVRTKCLLCFCHTALGNQQAAFLKFSKVNVNFAQCAREMTIDTGFQILECEHYATWLATISHGPKEREIKNSMEFMHAMVCFDVCVSSLAKVP